MIFFEKWDFSTDMSLYFAPAFDLNISSHGYYVGKGERKEGNREGIP